MPCQALLGALHSALELYRQPDHYAALRANAHAAAADVADTAWHWQGELQRLRACRAAVRLAELV